MKKTDVFLAGIVAAIVLLVVVALVIGLTQPQRRYQAEDTPEGVVHNYLLALQRGDYERAYSYLSPTLRGYPSSASRFTETVLANRWQFRIDQDVSVSVQPSTVEWVFGTVTVRETRVYNRGLLTSSEQVSEFDMVLIREDGEWKLASGKAYFADCWQVLGGC